MRGLSHIIPVALLACYGQPRTPAPAITAREAQLAGCYAARFGPWTIPPDTPSLERRQWTELEIALDTTYLYGAATGPRVPAINRQARLTGERPTVFTDVHGTWVAVADSTYVWFLVGRDGPSISLKVGQDQQGTAWQPDPSGALDGKRHGATAAVTLHRQDCP